MDPASAIGLASSILTFIDIGYKVVTGTLEIAQTGWAPHTEHIDAVACDLENAVAKFSQPVSPNASDPEKALGEISVSCQTVLTQLLALLERFKVHAAKPGISWDKFKVVIRRIRDDSKVEELQKSLAEYRSQILVHLVSILNDRQLATQVQIGDALGEARTDLRSIRDALDDVKSEILDKFEQVQADERSTIQPGSETGEPLPGQNALLDKIATQFQEVRDAIDRLEASHSEKTPETRILEHVYFGNSMFQREETLKPADEATFLWFAEGISNEDHDHSAFIDSERADPEEISEGVDNNAFMDLEITDREETSRARRIEALKAEVSSRFEKWLRSGHGVFHISGKAGSGKSTLMKLVLSTERTYELLREWAGDKRLLFARFYFWASGNQIQNSLEGLQRSILFEILIQRPDLVKEVFREAYPIVAHSSWDSPIHSRFFTTASFQKAFQQLILLPADPRYRLCLFIDGLDEFGADVASGTLPETQREDLAQSFADWASNDDIKILASSRPYPEFSETFAEDQRVHLHQLTQADMIEFGHHLFERHRVFRFPGVKEGYQDLVKKVVHASDGVFLWTGLTIQRMLTSLAKHDSFQSLEKQLDATPRGLNDLYDRMFSEIDENDRHEAMKMMLLVAEEQKYLGGWSHPGGLNAMAISWLESLEDLEFPANQPFVVYTEDEIEEKRKFAESRVNGYTRGLLEVTTHVTERDDDERWPFHLRHTVHFFHATALEYVAARAASPLSREALSSFSNIFNLEYYTRLSLAELHVGSLHGGAWNRIGRYQGILCDYFNTPHPRRSLIEAYKAAFEQQADYSAWRVVLACFNDSDTGEPFIKILMHSRSVQFDHWVANEVRGPYAAHYLIERVKVLPELLRPQDGLSLLLSAACSDLEDRYGVARLERVRMLLAQGADLHHVIRLKTSNSGLGGTQKALSMELSVWQAWCLYYISVTLSTRSAKREDLVRGQILELFLESGVDSDCHILMADTGELTAEISTEISDSDVSDDSESAGTSEADKPTKQVITNRPYTYTDLCSPADKWENVLSWNDRPKTAAYVVSFRDFIRRAKPANLVQLERLLCKDNRTEEFSTTELSDIEDELATSKHPTFKSPTVQPVNLDHLFGKSSVDQELRVYWIRWQDATIPGRLSLRLY